MSSEIETIDQPKPSFIETARRAQIIECAIDAIAELGFAQASLAQIAKRAGVSTGVILYYFAGKDALIRAVAAHVYTAGEAFVRPKAERQANAREALLGTFITATVDFFAAHPNYGHALMNIVRSGRTDAGAPLIDPALNAGREAGCAEILTWGQESGEFRAFSVPVMAASIIESIDAIPPQLVRDPDLDLDAYARELVELFDRATRADA
jgi:TetR/AcrR family transcriptional regulator, fatty acid metabolism regulator protein